MKKDQKYYNVCFYYQLLHLIIGQLLAIRCQAQTFVTAPMTGTPAAGQYYNNTSIALNPGFSFAASAGQSLQIYISSDCAQLITNPSTNQNFVLTSTPRTAGITTIGGLANRSTCDLMQSVQYLDALGRPIQTVQVKGSATLRDVVQPVAYDAYDRETIKYLPYSVMPSSPSDGSFKTTAISDQTSFYANPSNTSTWNAPGVVTTPFPVSVTGYEISPLNRITEQGFPGDNWQLSGTLNTASPGHDKRLMYITNNASSLSNSTGYWAKYYGVSYVYNQGVYIEKSKLTDNGAYPVDVLYVTVTKHENWSSSQTNLKLNTTEEYKDKMGRILVHRTFNYNAATSANEILSTYFVYDDYGNLTYVLPPLANADAGGISQSVLDNLCYQYRYDTRNRVIGKKMPGRGWELILCNTLNKTVATQDSVQRMKSPQEWTICKYDAMGRGILSGIYQYGNSPGVDNRAALQSLVDAQSAQWENKTTSGNGYTTNTWPASWSSTISINYYDDYSAPGLPYNYTSGSKMIRGLQTVAVVGILNSPGTMLWSQNYYDDFGRSIQSYKQHYFGGTASVNNYDLVTNLYNFDNQVSSTTRQHFNTNNTTAPIVTITNNYSYDHIGRKIQTSESINGATPIMLTKINFNETGQLLSKHLHSEDGGNTFLQDIPYSYNERGWLNSSGTSNNLFYYTLKYNQPDAGITKQFNGNIAEMLYTGQNSGSKTFGYSYDVLNRLAANTSTNGTLNEQINYDLAGNITMLTRSGVNAASLNYTYLNSGLSNQLTTVSNSGSTFRSYNYDGNGNAGSDGAITTPKSIAYNLLNLPQTVTQNGSTLATYTYEATGQKLRNSGSDGTWDYIDGIVYFNPPSNSGSTIQFIQTEVGRAVPNGATAYVFQYNLTDHLGNVRSMFYKYPSTGLVHQIQETEYYPFGLSSFQDNSSGNRYLYNGKEIQHDLINQLDYGGRFYDPIIARWTSQDQLAEKFYSYSTYNYVAGNPVGLIDPDGRNVSVSGNNVSFDNVGNDDAIAAFSLFVGKTSNAFLTIEPSSFIRDKINGNESFYGQWSVFAAASLSDGLISLRALENASGRRLTNLVYSNHGAQNSKKEGGNQIKITSGSTHIENFVYNDDLDVVLGNVYSGNRADCDQVEAKVDQLKELGDLVANGGKLIFAVCDAGRGSGGKDLITNLSALTGNRLNIFIANGWVTRTTGQDVKTYGYIPWIDGSFKVNNNPGWIQIKPNRDIIYRTSITINRTAADGPPIVVNP